MKRGIMMEPYQQMYAILCAGLSDALDLLPLRPDTAPARFALARALNEAEELYIGEPESES